MFKFIIGIAVGTQLGPYVNPYIAKYVLDPLLQRMHERDINAMEQWLNSRKR